MAGSTEIMRSLFTFEPAFDKILTGNIPGTKVPLVAMPPDMIDYLVEKGAKLDGVSLLSTLQRHSLEIFQHLLQTLTFEEETMHVKKPILKEVILVKLRYLYTAK